MKRMVDSRTGRYGNLTVVEWRYQDNPSEGGAYTLTKADGYYTVQVGDEVIAATVPDRVFRFLRGGISRRCYHVTDKYLHGIIPIPVDALCINFGANIGEVATALGAMGARVLAIEPDPLVLPALCANASGRTIDVAKCAAWNRDGQIDICLATESGDTSVFGTGVTVTVEARRIDSLVDCPVHLIVGDAEGAEPEVLEGAQETLKRTAWVSVRASAERNGESTLAACEAILKASDFEVVYKEETGFCTLIGRAK